MRYNVTGMLNKEKFYPAAFLNSICFGLFILSLLFLTFPAIGQTESFDFTFAEKDSCEYYLNGRIPVYRRSIPIAVDDPMKYILQDDTLIPYEHGYVYSDVNQHYTYNWFTRSWEGTAPVYDTGVMIGGNAASRLETQELDTDLNDFSRILPYASIYIEPEMLGGKSGRIEYEFFSDLFAFNNPGKNLPRNISIKAGKNNMTSYQILEPVFSEDGELIETKAKDWMGIVYTGGISKTVRRGSNNYTETLIEGTEDEPLFTIRYKNAALDRNGETYDLILQFKQVVFVAEADVEGPVAIMESDGVYLAPLLSEKGHYLVNFRTSIRESAGETDEGIRIGARFEYDYRIEDENGASPDGLIFFSMNDLDNPSMAPMLQTDADWGVNSLGADYKWAEGFGVVRGAASFAVLPYYNHTIPNVYRTTIISINGDTSLVRISRMKDSFTDGTANGLYFTAAVTASSGFEARNDGNTADTGVSMLIYPEGSMVVTASVGRRGSVTIPFFSPGVSCKIEQSAFKGGSIRSEDYSFSAACEKEPNTDLLKVVGSGSTSTHFIEPDQNYRIYRLKIDDVTIPYGKLQWEPGEDGAETALFELSDEYGHYSETTEYRFERDGNGIVSVSFENIQDAHAIQAVFIRNDIFGYLEVAGRDALIAGGIVIVFAALVIAAAVVWKKRRKEDYSEFY